MAIPPVGEFLDPVLRALIGRRSWPFSKLAEAAADHFGLSERERAVKGESSSRPRYKNRTEFCLLALADARLVRQDPDNKLIWSITESGTKFAGEHSHVTQELIDKLIPERLERKRERAEKGEIFLRSRKTLE